jgi:hypothetical protein
MFVATSWFNTVIDHHRLTGAIVMILMNFAKLYIKVNEKNQTIFCS